MNNPWYVWIMLGGTVMFLIWALWMKINGYTIG
jgi:hypothetical protein